MKRLKKNSKKKWDCWWTYQNQDLGTQMTVTRPEDFFESWDSLQKITGIDENLINKCKIILETISSGHKIDLSKFSLYCKETAKLYVKLYGWHPMSPTIRKIIEYGATVIEHALLPIGQLSEEAAKARNKHFRMYRQNFTRKFSRETCNRDVLNKFLLALIHC